MELLPYTHSLGWCKQIQRAQHGEGFHHTCLVYPSLEAVREAKTELRRQGRELIQEGSAGDVFDFGYFLFPEIGSVVEVLYLDAAKLPPPEAVIVATSDPVGAE